MYSDASGDAKITSLYFFLAIAVLIVLVIAVEAWFGSLVDEQTAINAMKAAGYSDVQIVDRQNWAVSFRGCSKEDAAKFDVVATNARGERVDNAYVCIGWPLKGATIRYR